MRRVSSVPSRTQSPAYGSGASSSGVSPSRGSLRASMGAGGGAGGSSYGSPIVTEPRPLPSIFSSTTLPGAGRASSPFASQRTGSPAALRRIGSTNSRSGSAGGAGVAVVGSRTTSPYQALAGEGQQGAGAAAGMGGSPGRLAGMTAMPQQHYNTASGLPPRSLLHDPADPYAATQPYDIYERMVARPDSLSGQNPLCVCFFVSVCVCCLLMFN